MKLQTAWDYCKWIAVLIFGAAIYALGFDLFLEPANINCGGGSGLAMIIKELTGLENVLGISSIAFFSLMLNIPLFIFGFRAVGKQFFLGSLISVVASVLLLHLFQPLKSVLSDNQDILLNSIFGGLLIGLSVGVTCLTGGSNGGTVIAARLLKKRFKNLSIGKLVLAVDIVVVICTGIVFREIKSSLYSAVTLYASSLVTDAVVYRFDYTKVVLIITDRYEEVADAIDHYLHRGVTMLKAQGYYKRQDKFVLLSAVKRHQLAELQHLVNSIDENAFVIVQEAHQVLGDGFKHYRENSL